VTFYDISMKRLIRYTWLFAFITDGGDRWKQTNAHRELIFSDEMQFNMCWESQGNRSQ